jgi:HD-GYP domain-containing protein (c-di-GMP phosphodiesterase class II)
MLSSIDDLAPSVSGVAHGLDAPIESRIVHVADAFDAMTSTRAYRRALTQDAAIAELHAKSGTQFDPSCVSALVVALRRRGEQYGAGVELCTEFETAPVVGVGSAGLGDLASEPS